MMAKFACFATLLVGTLGSFKGGNETKATYVPEYPCVLTPHFLKTEKSESTKTLNGDFTA